ncbi:MAG: hypothetical protein V7704_01555 [Aurantimonas endophytica]|uniref:hypothetical protein n=1 Tax=Aurantimonas endophytica TaxID=1522175 RepID=UPI0030027379
MSKPMRRHFPDQIDDQHNFNEYAALNKIQLERDVDVFEAIEIIHASRLPGEGYPAACKRFLGGVDAASPIDETDEDREKTLNSIDLRALQELVKELDDLR